MNADPELTKRSMARAQEIVANENAQLWLNYDIGQNATIAHAPAFFD